MSVVESGRDPSDRIAPTDRSSPAVRAVAPSVALRSRRLFPLLVAAALFVTAFYVSFYWNALLLHTQSVLHLNDLGKFYYDAQAFAEGKPMYGLSPATEMPLSDTVSKQLLNLNPPHMHLVLLPFVSLKPASMLGLWLVTGMACLAAVVYKSLRAAGAKISAWRFLWFGLAAVSTAAFGSILVTGQITMHVLPLILWAWLASRRGRWNQTAIALGLGISVKPFLLIFVPWLAIRGRISAACLSLLTCALCFAVGVAVFGAANHTAWLASLAAIDWYDLPLNASLQAFLDRSLQDSLYFAPLIRWPDAAAALWFTGFTLIGVLSLSVAILDRSPERIDRTFCLLLLAALLMCPLGWVYYLFLALPPAVGLLSRGANPGHGAPSSKERARKLRRAALATGCALIFLPTPILMAGQPSALLTVSFGSAHFWAVFFFWMATCCDGLISLAAQRVRLRDVARHIHARAGLISVFGWRRAGDDACAR